MPEGVAAAALGQPTPPALPTKKELADGLAELSALLSLTSSYYARISRVADRPTLRAVQAASATPASLLAASELLKAEDRASLLGVFIRANALGPQLAQFGNLPPPARTVALAELDSIAADMKALAAKLGHRK